MLPSDDENPSRADAGQTDVECPVCGKINVRYEVLTHLMNDHDWSQQDVNEEFGEQAITKVSSPSPPVPDDQLTPAYSATHEGVDYDVDLSESYEEVTDERDLCDCDPAHKETQVVQRESGGQIGPVGGNKGDGTTVIICTNCGRRFYEKDNTDTGIFPGPGTF